jgi:hypothetical protein
MRAVRLAAVACGIVAGGYGVWLLLSLGWANTRSTTFWLVGGVVVHDAVFAPLVLGVAWVALRSVPRRRLAPWVVVLMIVVPVTLAGMPELGRFGARADNPTLLDRHYWWGWLLLVTLVLGAALVGIAASAVGRRTASGGGDDGPGAGGG